MNNSYCPTAFREIYANNAGQYKLCCHANVRDNLKKYNTSNTLPFEFFTSEEMEKIRTDMFEGKPIEGCETCYNLEKITGKSYRIDKYIKKYGYETNLKDIGLILRINGSYCNLGCYMCHPYNSSTRRNELKELYGTNNEWNTIKFQPTTKVSWDSIVNNLLENIHLISYMNMTGGEPLQLPKMWELLDKIPEKYAKNITLTYDSNLTKLKYKKYTIDFLIEKFKQVRIGVSCDHYEDKLAWIRYPINVKEFEDNLVKAKYIISNLNCTVSLLNIDEIFEIRDYYKNKFDLNVTFTNVVSWPKPLSIRNLSKDKKEKYIEKYSEFSYIVGELKIQPYKGNMLQEAEKYFDDLSAHRNFNWRDLWSNT